MLFDRIIRKIRARIVRREREEVERLSRELRDIRGAFDTATVECRDLRYMRDHYEAEASALSALHLGAVEERDSLRERLGIVHPAEAKGRRKVTAEERDADSRRRAEYAHKNGYGRYLEEIVSRIGPATSRQIAAETTTDPTAYPKWMHTVSDYARCGYLTVTKIKGVPHYSLPVVGPLTNCDSCLHDDRPRGCKIVLRGAEEEFQRIDKWAREWRDGNMNPKPNATGCPGHSPKS